MNSVELIKALSNANGAPGFEDEVVEVLKVYAEDLGAIEEDYKRNLYIHRKQNSGKLKVMVDGHSDEVGFMVQSINAKGLISFIPLGGWIDHTVSGQCVRIRNNDGDYVKGVIATKPVHFMNATETNSGVKISDMQIDVGAISRDEVINDFGITVGAPIVPDVEFYYNDLNDTMIGKAFDNRIGSALVVDVLNELKDETLSIDIVGTVSSQEEVGTRGAIISARKVKPDLAIVFEGTPADDAFRGEFEMQAGMKRGPQIRHVDRGMISNPRFVKFAIDTAKANGLSFQEAVRSSGGTNGGAIHLSEEGIPTIVISVPVRYIHAHYGICAKVDYESAKQWIVEVLKGLNKEVIKDF